VAPLPALTCTLSAFRPRPGLLTTWPHITERGKKGTEPRNDQIRAHSLVGLGVMISATCLAPGPRHPPTLPPVAAPAGLVPPRVLPSACYAATLAIVGRLTGG